MIRARNLFAAGLGLAWVAAGPSVSAQELSPNTAANSTVSAQTAQQVSNLIVKSYHDIDQGDLDDALVVADSALQLDPRNPAVYELRGGIYLQKQLWDRAEDDYTTALTIAPTTAVDKYKLAEVKFLQKAYDAARPRYVLIQNDENLGDLATYKIFLCDLLGGHQDRAARELAVLNQADAGTTPAHFFANAAWSSAHGNSKEASTWITLGRQIFDPSKTDPYLASMSEGSSVKSPIVSFTSKAGVRYSLVRVFIENGGLRISTAKGGWTTIPFDQLPDDLSVFPLDLRRKIVTQRQALPEDQGGSNILSFKTRQGKLYDNVRTVLSDEGLQVVTPDGLINVPFDQLPDDLSPFPADLRRELASRRQKTSPSDKAATILSFQTKAGKQYEQVRASLGDDGLQVLSPDGLVNVPLAQLPDDLSAFPTGLQRQIAEKRKASSPTDDDTPLVNFTTKAGKKFEQSRVVMVDDGLQALTPDGWVVVPLAQLPDDLSPFSSQMRERIARLRQGTPAAGAPSDLVSFTTKQNKTYDQVRAFPVDSGLQVLTSDGLAIIPFDQLPADLSAFPESLRKEIQARRKAAGAPETDSRSTSFTTKKGMHYDQIRLSVVSDGVLALTPDGWVTIPFDQLPDDLSSFSDELRKQIAMEQQRQPDKRSNAVPPAKAGVGPATTPTASLSGDAGLNIHLTPPGTPSRQNN